MESYLMAKGLLTEETKLLRGPIQRILPPAPSDPTVNHVLPKATQPDRPFIQQLPVDWQAAHSTEPTSETLGERELISAGTTTNYNIKGWVNQEPTTAARVTMVLDTGAGPNIVATKTLRLG